MYEILKKENKKSESFQNRTTLKRSVNSVYKDIDKMPYCNNRQQYTNRNDGLFPKYNMDLGSHNCISKNREIIQMKLFNSMKKGTEVKSLEDLIIYMKDIYNIDIDIQYNMFGGVSQSIIDEAIQELDDADISEVYDEPLNIIQVIKNKISELATMSEAESQMQDVEEQNRIQDLQDRLKKMVRSHLVKGQKGEFVGNEAGWHIHIVSGSSHLKFGSGSRWDIHLENKQSIIDAVNSTPKHKHSHQMTQTIANMTLLLTHSTHIQHYNASTTHYKPRRAILHYQTMFQVYIGL